MEKKELHQAARLLQSAQENNSVQKIEFHFKDGQTYCIEDETLLQSLLNSSITGFESQIHKENMAKIGEFRENLQYTKEYKFAMEVERTLNNYNFSNRNFVESIPFFHRTIQQSLFRLFQDSFLYMAGLDEHRYVDGRNQRAYELSQKLANTMKESHLPMI